MIKRIIFLCAALVLSGCSAIVKTKIKEVPVYRVEYVFLAVPDHMVKPHNLPVPPSVPDYMSLSFEDKEDLLVNYSRDLISELKMCSADKKAIASLIAEKKKIVQEMNQAIPEQSK